MAVKSAPSAPASHSPGVSPLKPPGLPMNIPSGLPSAEEIAEQAARILLEIKAVSFNSRDPFTWTSGRKAPTYVDCRKVISFPRARTALLDFAAATVIRDIGYEALDAIAGGETA